MYSSHINVFIDWVLCGSFLISFAGKYLAYDYCFPSLCGESGDTEGVPASFDHQLLKICVPHTEPDLFGPAFIEVGFWLLFSVLVFLQIFYLLLCSSHIRHTIVLKKHFQEDICNDYEHVLGKHLFPIL